MSAKRGSRVRLDVHRCGKEAPVTARRGDDGIAARAGDGGRLRASHADREQVIDTLKAAFGALGDEFRG